MSLTKYHTSTTLDGFIADPDNSFEWLFRQDIDQTGQGGYEPFISGIGALVMGRTTYELILDHEFKDKPEPEWVWPYDIPCWVLSHRTLIVVPGADIRFTPGDVAEVHTEMQAVAGGSNLWVVGGGDPAGQFADSGLFDEVGREQRMNRDQAGWAPTTAILPSRPQPCEANMRVS